jgi:WD40 repeat protein
LEVAGVFLDGAFGHGRLTRLLEKPQDFTIDCLYPFLSARKYSAIGNERMNVQQVFCLSIVWLWLAASPSLSAQEPKLRDTLKGHMAFVSSVAYSPDGKTLASGSADTTIKLWDVATGKEQATLKGHTDNTVTSVAYSPDGKTLASGSWETTIKLWDVATGKEQATLKGHTHYVYSVAYSPDGKTLASGSYDETIKLWDVATGKQADK